MASCTLLQPQVVNFLRLLARSEELFGSIRDTNDVICLQSVSRFLRASFRLIFFSALKYTKELKNQLQRIEDSKKDNEDKSGISSHQLQLYFRAVAHLSDQSHISEMRREPPEAITTMSHAPQVIYSFPFRY